jgi:hypothetical protein
MEAELRLLRAVVDAARECLKPGQTNWRALREALSRLEHFEKTLKVAKKPA